MATHAETLAAAPVRTKAPRLSRKFFDGLRRWARNGQLGSSSYTEMGRYTGGRI